MISKNTSDFYSRQSNLLLTVSIPVNLASVLRAVRAGGSAAGQTHISCPAQVVSFSFDTLYLSYHLKIEDGRIFERLRKAKELLQQSVDSSTSFDFETREKFSWSLQRTGIKYYPFVLRAGDVTFCLSSRAPESNMPNATVQIGSITCQGDIKKSLRDFKWWLSVIGLQVIEEKVGRFDIAADFACDINDCDISDDTKMICRATQWACHKNHRVLSGVSIGKGDISLRIYDKQLEMKIKQNTEKIEFFNDKWNLFPHNPVTRVEFQVRGCAVRELIGERRTFDDVYASMNCVWEYLTQDWCRFCENSIDRVNKNHSRAKESGFWMSVQDVIDDDSLKAKRTKKVKHISVTALLKQARGIMISVCAAMGEQVDDYFGIISRITKTLTDEVSEYMLTPEYEGKFLNKQALSVLDLGILQKTMPGRY